MGAKEQCGPRRGTVCKESRVFLYFFVFDLDFCKALTNLIVYYPSVKA